MSKVNKVTGAVTLTITPNEYGRSALNWKNDVAWNGVKISDIYGDESLIEQMSDAEAEEFNNLVGFFEVLQSWVDILYPAPETVVAKANEDKYTGTVH